MKIGFHIEYHTRWGQNLRITGSCKALGAGDPSKAPLMSTGDGVNWHHTIEATPGEEISYSYFVTESDGTARHEWGAQRSLVAGAGCKSVETIDRWHDRPADKPFYSTAFGKCIFARSGESHGLKP